MRLPLTLVLAGLAAGSFGQAAPRESLFRTVKPEATVVVRKHRLGADLVEITVLNPQYPSSVLRAQAEAIGKYLKLEPRGVLLIPEDLGNGGVLNKITFGVDGLYDPQQGVYRLNPIVKAMAGIPAPYTLHGLSVIFEQATPGPQSLRNFYSDAVRVESDAQPGIGVEYRVQLLTQDPDRIDIPDTSQQASVTVVRKQTARSDGFLWGLIVVAALALGALVYSLVLRVRPPVRSRPS